MKSKSLPLEGGGVCEADGGGVASQEALILSIMSLPCKN